MQDGSLLPRQLAQQRQGDDALAAARPAGDDDDLFGTRPPRTLDGVHNEFVGQALLGEEDELLPFLDLLGREREQPLRRTDRALE